MGRNLLIWTLLLVSASISKAQDNPSKNDSSSENAITITPSETPSFLLTTFANTETDQAPDLNLTSTIRKELPSSPKMPPKSEALTANDEAGDKSTDIVPVVNISIDGPSTTSQTAVTDESMTPNSTMFHTSEDNLTTMTSKVTEKEPSTRFHPSPVKDLDSTEPSTDHDVSYTTTDRKNTTEHEMNTHDHIPSDTTEDNNKENGGKKENKISKKDKGQIVLIAVIIIILVLLSIIMIILVIRKKRRSGSQTFHTQSRNGNRQDVWAGQVPELGDGKMVQDPEVVGNGTTGNQTETEKEMTTFVSGEKKTDSMVEMDELVPGGGAGANGGEKLGKEDSLEEERPLLEGDSEGAQDTEVTTDEDLFPMPPVEQALV
ncbi:uncharacterized protein LOC142097234 [Mixophyes fleayi]|uniref:uncharacterized protein LOC142097234 n=1 Tax=Mixophyes fleayi TaxID=3061075 RepID=UPI003F4D9332